MKYVLLLILFCCSCQKHKMYYDIENQRLVSCNNIAFNYFSVEDNTEKFTFIWKDSTKGAPLSINLKKIPKGFSCRDGLKDRIFQMKPNKTYLIEKSGQGKISNMIKIWSNSSSNVYKTTHSNCDYTNGGVPKKWVQ